MVQMTVHDKLTMTITSLYAINVIIAITSLNKFLLCLFVYVMFEMNNYIAIRA